MKDRKKKYPNLNPNFAFLVSEPRFLPHTERSVPSKSPRISITKESIFKIETIKEEYKDEQFSHAIYELEIANKVAKGNQ